MYVNTVDALAAANFLAYIICDETLCYGTNFPIANVILTDSLAEKLTINETFQLIGRAGRVGQSWTARAFLEEKGLGKLKDYIKAKDKSKYNKEAQIFETMAEKLLEQPPVYFKTSKYVIREYANEEVKTLGITLSEIVDEVTGGKVQIRKVCVIPVKSSQTAAEEATIINESKDPKQASKLIIG